MFFNPYDIFIFQDDIQVNRHLDSTTKEVKYNPKYEELFAPEVCKRIFNYDNVKIPNSINEVSSLIETI
jgi:hypothetical protein